MKELHVYTDGTDTVVAYDERDAREALIEQGHLSREYADSGDPFERVPDDKILDIGFEDPPEAWGHAVFEGLEVRRQNDGGHWACRVATTAGDWAKRFPRGMLCSTEY